MNRLGAALILILILAGFSFVPSAFAQGYNPIPSAEEVGTIVDEKSKAGQTSKEVYSINTQAILANGVTCFIAGCSNNPESTFYYGKSAVASMGMWMAALYNNPPANLALWINDTGQSLGFIPKQAYAQGIGFSGLSALLPIWKAFRNISYALLAVVMVVVGFMVMFRQKIDPKTVVTVQNAIPRIVLALILVTFSYAIAALFIDIMYLVMAIIINLIVGASDGALGADTATKYINGGFGTAAAALFWGGWSSMDDIIKLLFYSSPEGKIPWATWIINVATLGIYPLLQGVLVGLIVSIALLFGLVRIFFMLVSAYIRIIVAVLIAPFQLMTVAFPGSTSLSSWLKNMLADLSVFPVTAAMLLVGTILTQSNVARIWTPPLLSSSGAKGIGGLIGLGVLLTIPSIANGIKEALKAKAPIEAGLGAILGPLGAGAGQAMQLGYQGMFIASPFLHKNQPSTPGGRQIAAGQGGAQNVIQSATGSSGGGHP